MSAASTNIHTIDPGANIPFGYFDEENIRFIQQKIIDVLLKRYKQEIRVDRGSIIKVMGRILVDRIEPVPNMNQRVVMDIVSEYINHQIEMERNLKFEEHYHFSQSLYDPTTNIVRYDPSTIKLANRLGKPRVGGSSRFYFT